MSIPKALNLNMFAQLVHNLSKILKAVQLIFVDLNSFIYLYERQQHFPIPATSYIPVHSIF